MTHEHRTSGRRALSWLAPIITAAICAAAISLFLNKPRKNDAAREGSADAERIAALEEQLKRSNTALRRLEAVQLAQGAAAEYAANNARPAINAEQAAAEERPAEHAAAITEEAQPAAYPEEREKAFFDAYFAELQQAMSRQRTDRQLSAQLMSLIPGVDRGLVHVLDLSCTEELCRLEARYQHADRASRDAFVDDLQKAFAPLMTRASIHLPTDENRLLGYFAKKGAKFPRPTTSFASFMRGDEG